LKKTHQQDYQVIFTTAFDHSGIKAIKFSGVDYLQKPIDIEGLQSSITGIIAKQHTSAGKIAIQHLLYTLDNNNVPAQLVVQTEEGQEYIPVDGIIYIEASDNTCIFNTDKGRIASTGMNIQEYEHLLAEYNFYRLHHAYIVNTRKVVESSKPDSGFIRMTNESTIPVSSKRSGELNTILSANG
jgi:two-component system LytT family response regulator